MSSEPITATDNTTPRIFYHGTRADLKPGNLIAPGYSSNYGARKQASWVYLTGTMDAAIWGCEPALSLFWKVCKSI
ncbi:MAG TPA: NAD(+)--rifampin ADP-ribosyltransferase [Allosphingosinicella sp.]|nr:NAD(+)--rifampin ADP-ribosyltransferase [Allosphingosinicella sp.]